MSAAGVAPNEATMARSAGPSDETWIRKMRTLSAISPQVASGGTGSLSGLSSYSGKTIAPLGPLLRSRHSAVLSRHPYYVVRALAVEESAGAEQEIRQPVDVFEGRGRDLLVRLLRQFDHQPLAAAADGA